MHSTEKKHLLIEVQKRVLSIVESTKKIEYQTAELVELFRKLEKKES